MNGRPVYCNGWRTQFVWRKDSQEMTRDEKQETMCLLHAAKKTYPLLAEKKHCTVWSQKVKYDYDDHSQQGVVWNTCIKWMNCHVVLFTFTQALYYHLTFDVEKKVDCRFLCSKRLFKAFLQCSCLWFLIVWSQCYNLRQSSSPFHGRWCLGTLDSTDESHYISNPVNYLGCISETVRKPYWYK